MVNIFSIIGLVLSSIAAIVLVLKDYPVIHKIVKTDDARAKYQWELMDEVGNQTEMKAMFKKYRSL